MGISGRPGAILAAEREKQGVSLEQVAEQLKLAPRQITALEKDDYGQLPGMAIVRGFVRAYAKFLKLDAAPLVAMIEVESGLAQQNTVRVNSSRFAETPMPSSHGRSMTPLWIGGSALLAVVVAVLAWVQTSGSRLPQLSASADTRASASAVVASTASAAASTVVTALPSPLPASDAGAPAPQATPTPQIDSNPTAPGTGQAASPTPVATTVPAGLPQTTPVPSQPAAAPSPVASLTPTPANALLPSANPQTTPSPAANANNQLVLKLRQDSWVEVRRVNGPVLVSRLLKAGSTETVDVSGPVQLLVGNVNGVEASLRGSPLNLKTGPGNTARLTVK